MLKFNYYSPTEIVFGKGRKDEVGNLIKKFGVKKVAVIYGGESAKKNGLLDMVKEKLNDEGIEVLLLGGVVPNPLLSKGREIGRASCRERV